MFLKGLCRIFCIISFNMKEFDDLIKVVRVLRSPGGCPWDRAQKLSSYKKYLLEEAYELIESINRRKVDLAKEELGDLFLILVVISEFFREKGKFNVRDSLKSINRKLISRHPHVFSSKKLRSKQEVLKYWIKTKAKKKNRKTIKDRLPSSAPALFAADIFFREYTHLKHACGKRLKREALSLIPLIIEKLESFDKKKNKEKMLADIVFELAALAFAYQADLEGSLRGKVLAEASKIPYSSVKIKKKSQKYR